MIPMIVVVLPMNCILYDSNTDIQNKPYMYVHVGGGVSYSEVADLQYLSHELGNSRYLGTTSHKFCEGQFERDTKTL